MFASFLGKMTFWAVFLKGLGRCSKKQNAVVIFGSKDIVIQSQPSFTDVSSPLNTSCAQVLLSTGHTDPNQLLINVYLIWKRSSTTWCNFGWIRYVMKIKISQHHICINDYTFTITNNITCKPILCRINAQCKRKEWKHLEWINTGMFYVKFIPASKNHFKEKLWLYGKYFGLTCCFLWELTIAD